MNKGYSYLKDEVGIVTVTLDMVGQPVNLMNDDFDELLSEFVGRINAEPDLAGVIITSAKEIFFAGGDLKSLLAVEKGMEEAFFTRLELIKANFRTLETLGKPVVAAINGAALGGGMELALCCHARIAMTNPKTKLGCPEVTLGLLPGAGGITRLVRMMGLERALPYLIEGKSIGLEQAVKEGWINDLADTHEEMMAKARDFIVDHPEIQNPWDQKNHKIPGGTPTHPKIAQMLMVAPAMTRKKTRGLMPAPEKILAVMVEGSQVDFEAACRLESRALTELVTHPVTKNLISTFFFGLNDLKAGASRPAIDKKSRFRKVGILGAGMMGAGIAYAAAKAGIDVVLKDISLAGAEKGKAYSEMLLTKAIKRGRVTDEKKQLILSRIEVTENVDDLSDCDLVIEAVFEDEKLKSTVTRETEAVLKEGVIFASNTSTLPISMLAEAARDPSRFIGLHFFSPVDKMPLVEIITGDQTSDETLAAAFDFVLQIKKTPIVVNDSLGFFTSRVFGTYMDEGLQLLEEGIDPIIIDNLAKQAGMPVGPLTVMDEVSQKLVHSINQTNDRLIAGGLGDEAATHRPASRKIVPLMMAAGRAGRAYGGGFYDYSGGAGQARKAIWPGLKDLVDRRSSELPYLEIQDRLIFRQVIESLKCLEEKVLNNVMDGNIGSIFGIGFPQHTGGVFQYINSYGLTEFCERAQELSRRFGPRFEPPKILLDQLSTKDNF